MYAIDKKKHLCQRHNTCTCIVLYPGFAQLGEPGSGVHAKWELLSLECRQSYYLYKSFATIWPENFGGEATCRAFGKKVSPVPTVD